MPVYNYKAKDKYGVALQGTMEASTPSVVAGRLSNMGYVPVYILAKEATLQNNLEELLARFQKVKPEDMIVFARQLSSILGAGVPLLESLEALYEQMVGYKFKSIILQIRRDIESGSSFSEALEKHKTVFPLVFVFMVRAGEKAGILGEVLERLAKLMERDYENVQKIKSSTRYPIIVLTALVVAFMTVVTFVIPRFSALYSSFKTELPLPTRILLGLNYVIVNYWYIILLVVIGAWYLFRRALHTERGKLWWDHLMLSLPVFGPLVNKLILARFCRMLASMLKSGIPVVEGLTITSDTVENAVISKVIRDVREEVIRGGGLAEPLRGSRVFPPLAVQMVAIGEKAGALESMLTKIADYFDRDADYTITNLTPLLEPALILVLAFLVVLLAMGVFLPMWDMVKFIK